MTLEVTTTAQLAELVRSQPRVRVGGGRTKSALSNSANVSLSKLTGILQYNPEEFTFTARAGTRLAEIEQMLGEKQQYLPFDPPLVTAGATLGGTVAAGLSGSGRFRYGGVRDFLLGAQLVTGRGEIVTTGSQVVKNAAGFDFPKLMVGSLGRFGVMTELTFKVFPAPQNHTTLVFQQESLASAVTLMNRLACSPFDLASLDLDPSHRVWARVAGNPASAEERVTRILQLAKSDQQVLTGDDDLAAWHACREFDWVPDGFDLMKVAVTPDQVAPLVDSCGAVPYRIAVGGNLAWVAWRPAALHFALSAAHDQIITPLANLGLSALALTGTWPSPYLGVHQGTVFENRLVKALDPEHKLSLSAPAST